MTPELISEITQSAIWTAWLLGAPILVVSLVVGVVVSTLQAATQVNEMTLTFIPKVVAAGLTLWIMSGWMLDQWLNYTRNLFVIIETVAAGGI